MVTWQQQVSGDHSVSPFTILWTDLVDWAIVAFPIHHSVDLTFPVRLDLSRPTSWGEISDEDPITWLEVSPLHLLITAGFSTGCSSVSCSGSDLVHILYSLFSVTHIILIGFMGLVSFDVEQQVDGQAGGIVQR